eukprot:1158726-Pelagomonas_calceolata.AAC.1
MQEARTKFMKVQPMVVPSKVCIQSGPMRSTAGRDSACSSTCRGAVKKQGRPQGCWGIHGGPMRLTGHSSEVVQGIQEVRLSRAFKKGPRGWRQRMARLAAPPSAALPTTSSCSTHSATYIIARSQGWRSHAHAHLVVHDLRAAVVLRQRPRHCGGRAGGVDDCGHHRATGQGCRSGGGQALTPVAGALLRCMSIKGTMQLRYKINDNGGDDSDACACVV